MATSKRSIAIELHVHRHTNEPERPGGTERTERHWMRLLRWSVAATAGGVIGYLIQRLLG